ncbi:MAG: guanylate kinase, partial [Duncaniella sp.]|nr:guanylate kinase [Duncaniella sp.]
MTQGRIFIFSAPSGSGKSTIISALRERGDIDMQFSVSATNRPPREGETDGVHYHFLSTPEFEARIAAGDFVEYEEVYPGRFYGTLRSEIDRILDSGHNCVLDIDVKGALNVKRLYGSRALSIFIMPPGLDELRRRLEGRGTEEQEWIEKRLAKAQWEMDFAGQFDRQVINDDLPRAVAEVAALIK